MLRKGPGILRIGAGLRVGNPRICRPRESCLAYARAVGPQCLNFSPRGHLRIDEPGNVEARGELMRSVPVARRGGDAREGLQAAPALVQALEIVADRPSDEQHIGLGDSQMAAR